MQKLEEPSSERRWWPWGPGGPNRLQIHCGRRMDKSCLLVGLEQRERETASRLVTCVPKPVRDDLALLACSPSLKLGSMPFRGPMSPLFCVSCIRPHGHHSFLPLPSRSLVPSPNSPVQGQGLTLTVVLGKEESRFWTEIPGGWPGGCTVEPAVRSLSLWDTLGLG